MALILRGGKWHYDFTVGGERFQGATGFKENEKAKALGVEEKRKVEVREGHSIDMIWEQTKRKMAASQNVELDFDSVWDAFSSKGMLTAGEERKKLYAGHIRDFCSWMQGQYPAVKVVAKVTEAHAKEYIQALREAAGANSTKNDKLATLKMLFEALGKSAGVVENPFSSIKNLPMNKISREIYTTEELKKIGDNATGWIYSLCLTALCTGLREGDICLLKRSSVDLSAGWLFIPRIEKTGKPLDIPILPSLAVHLQERLQAGRSEYVFPDLAEKYQKDSAKIGKDIKVFFAEIGIGETMKEVKGYAKKISSKDIHSFRHTFVYLAALNGIPFPIVQSIVGHASPAMTRIYMDHAGRRDKAKYFEQLPSYLAVSAPPETQNAPRKILTRERVIDFLAKLNPKNIERAKVRLTAMLQREEK